MKIFRNTLLIAAAALVINSESSMALEPFPVTSMATNNAGQLIPNVPVDVRVRIYQNFDYVNVIYSEEFTAVQSNGFGLVQVTLGVGSPAFDAILPANNLEMWVEVKDNALNPWNTVGIYNITNTVIEVFKSGLGFTIEPEEIVLNDAGSILISSPLGKGAELTIAGTNGQILASNGSAPVWTAPSDLFYDMFSATAPLVYNNTNGNFSIPAATTLVDGYLSAATLNTLNTGISDNAQDIADEITRATGIEGGLRTDVDANTQAIADETTRATGIEGGLRTDVDANTQAIADETTRATGIEGGLRTDLDAHTTADLDLLVGNEIANVAADASLTRAGSGTTIDPYTVTLNAAHSNSWGDTQIFPNTAAQGNALISSVNAGTTSILGVRVNPDFVDQPISTNVQIVAGNLTLLSSDPLDPTKDGSLTAEGTVTGLAGFVGDLTGNVTGNASTATALETPRAINGVDFDGTAPITITANTPNALTQGDGITAFTFNGSAAQTVGIADAGVTYPKLQNAVAANKVLVSQGDFSWAEGDVSALDEVAMTTVNTIPVWDGTDLVDGSITDDGTLVTIGSVNQVNIDMTTGSLMVDGESMLSGNVSIGSAGTPATFTLNDVDLTADLTKLNAITATAAELNQLTGSTVVTADLDKLHSVTADAAELNTLDGITATTAELNIMDGVTATTAELNILTATTAVTADLNKLHDVTADAAELNTLDGITATTAELNTLDGITATTAELNILTATTAVTADLNKLHDVTADAAEINTLDGITATTAEINIMDGVTATTANINLLAGIGNGVSGQFLKTNGDGTTVWGDVATTLQAIYDEGDADLILDDVIGDMTISGVNSGLIVSAEKGIVVSGANGIELQGGPLALAAGSNISVADGTISVSNGSAAGTGVTITNSNNMGSDYALVVTTNGGSDGVGGNLGSAAQFNVINPDNADYAVMISTVGNNSSTGLFVENQGTTNPLAISVADEGGAVKFSFRDVAGDDLGVTLEDDATVYKISAGAATGAFTVALPTATVAGKIIFIKNASGFIINLDNVEATALGNTLGITLVCDGTTWLEL